MMGFYNPVVIVPNYVPFRLRFARSSLAGAGVRFLALRTTRNPAVNLSIVPTGSSAGTSRTSGVKRGVRFFLSTFPATPIR